MPRLSEAQNADRRTYLGASDIPTLLGINPYQTPFELWLEKRGELDTREAANEQTRNAWERGHRLEDVALDWDAELRGLSIERVRRDIRHPRLPFVVVHPDARVKPWRSSRKLLEAKTSGRRWDEVPQRVEAQVQMQIAAAGADSCDVVLLSFDGPPVPYEVPRNDELIAVLEDVAAKWWDRHIVRGETPPIDGGKGTSQWLDRLFREGEEAIADDSQAAALARLLAIRAEVKRLEAEDATLVNALKWSMAGASRLVAPGVGRIVHTAPATTRSVKWREVAQEYAALLEGSLPTEAIGRVIAEHTTERTGRTFRPSPWKEQKGKA